MDDAALRELLELTGLPPAPAGSLTVTGEDPVVRTPYRVATAGAAVQAAIGIALAEMHRARTGRAQRIDVDLRAAGWALRALYYTALDGTSFHEIQGLDPWFGFYPVRDGRWIRLHTQMPPHRKIALDMLGNPTGADAARRATLAWDGFALEDELHAAGGCAAMVRSEREWSAHPQSAAVAAQPLVEIRRIGDGPREPAGNGERPLGGVRVLDLTCVLAGPTCARTLADHGADVLRIGSSHFEDSAVSQLDAAIGKRYAEVDLRARDGLETLRGLVREADVFSQGYRPGSLAARGFSPEDLAKLRPGIVYVELSAWGDAGPWRRRRGFDTMIQAASGMCEVQGSASDPGVLPVASIDYVTGYLMALGTVVALRRRALEGGSWHVRTSLARSGRWICERGLVDPEQLAGASGEPREGEIAALSAEIDSPLGRIRYLKSPLALSETMPYISLPPVPLGYHPPQWPARAPAAT